MRSASDGPWWSVGRQVDPRAKVFCPGSVGQEDVFLRAGATRRDNAFLDLIGELIEPVLMLIVFCVVIPFRLACAAGLTVLRMTCLVRTRVDVTLSWRPKERPLRAVSLTVVMVRGWCAAGRLVRELRTHSRTRHLPLDPRRDPAVVALFDRAGARIVRHEHAAGGNPPV
ncbi:hypothetical protein WEH80_20280 [Actinomycetes bacterium KLBMP 9759]